jgi:hypothetical protein
VDGWRRHRSASLRKSYREDYLYLDLGTTHAIANNQQVMTLTTQFGSRVTDQLVRAGLNYKFDWDPGWW